MYELDGLRGIAACVVVLFHYVYLYDFRYQHSFEFHSVFSLGHLGVHLFFIISGFVIYWTLTRSASILEFSWSRFSRLFPAYWLSVTITFFVISLFGLPMSEVTFTEYLINLTMLQDFLWIKKVDGSYWSLAYELAFYFWMALAFFFLRHTRIETILIIWMLVSFLVKYLFVGEQAIVPNVLHHKSPHLVLIVANYIYLFAAGICFYKIWSKSANTLTIFTLGITLVLNFYINSFDNALIISSFYVVFVLVINQKAKVLGYKPLVFIGGISYSLYLIHQNIGYVIIRAFYENNLPPLLGIFVATLTAIILAWLINIMIERPALKVLREFKISRKLAVVTKTK